MVTRRKLKEKPHAAFPSTTPTDVALQTTEPKRRKLVGVAVDGVPVSFNDREQAVFNGLLDAFDKVSGVPPGGRLMERVVLHLSSLLVSDKAWNPSEKPSEDTNERMRLMTAYLSEIGPTTGVQTMLAVQMIGVHEAAVKALVMTKSAQDVVIQEAIFLRATRLMRLFNEQLEAMAKLKGTAGQQKVIVEHVHVHQGGQAVVGVVTAPSALPGGTRGAEAVDAKSTP
jgi:hypothetical protein